MTGINDLVLVHIDNKPAFFARIDAIEPDVKAGWWQVRLLVLTLPLQAHTWKLDESQINGAPFTMGGTPVALEKVISPVARQEETNSPFTDKDAPEGKMKKKGAKVVLLAERKRN